MSLKSEILDLIVEIERKLHASKVSTNERNRVLDRVNGVKAVVSVSEDAAMHAEPEAKPAKGEKASKAK